MKGGVVRKSVAVLDAESRDHVVDESAGVSVTEANTLGQTRRSRGVEDICEGVVALRLGPMDDGLPHDVAPR